MEALAPLLHDRRQLEARLSSRAVLPGLPAMFVPFQPGSLKPQGLTRWHLGGSCTDSEFCLLAGQQNNATWSSIVGNGWEQGSCNRNIGTSRPREAGEAGRRRNLSRKRTFVSDTSKIKISLCRRNVSNIGSAAGLARHSLQWIQHSCKSV